MKRIITCSITKCLIVILYFAFVNSMNAQYNNWEPIGPEGGPVTSIVVTSEEDIIVTSQGRVFTKMNSNENWNLSNKGLEDVTVNVVSTDSTAIYAGTSDGVYKSTDIGKTWFKVNEGIENTFILNILCYNGIVYSTVRDDSSGRNNHFYYSLDGGINWIKINTDIVSEALALGVNDSYIFISTFGKGVLRSDDLGNTWQQVNNGIKEYYMGGFFASYLNANNNFVVVEIMEDGFYISKDDGENWNKYIESNSNEFVEFTLNNDELYYYSNSYGFGFLKYGGNVDKSIDLTKNLPGNNFLCLEIKGGKLYVGTQTDGLFISNDYGNSWNQTVRNFNQLYIEALHSNNSTTFAGNTNKICKSMDIGTTWNKYYFVSQIANFKEFFEINRNNNSIYFLISANMQLCRSSDQGIMWNLYDNGLQFGVRDIIQCGGKVLAATTNGASELSFLNEQNNRWEANNNSGITQNKVNSLIEFGNFVLAGTQKGIFESHDYGVNWIEKSNSNLNIEIKKFLKATNHIFALTADGIYISNKLAESWEKVNNENFEKNIVTLLCVQDYLFVATDEGMLYLTKDLGESWSVIYDGSSKSYFKISTLARSGDYLLIGTKGSSIVRAKFSDLGLLVGVDEELATQSEIIISPNPSSDFITITLSNNGLKPFGATDKVQIFDVLGIEILSELIHPMPSSHRMNVEKLPAGVYFIRIGDKVEKFVKM